jgi:predicted deacetylase
MPAAKGVRALVSVHDVMPETLERVQRILDLCASSDPRPLTLLVVPGLDWDQASIRRLRHWEAQGHRLAGHGWRHATERFGGLAHRLHGLFVSRGVAEHLVLDGSGIEDLIRRCHAWFPANRLKAPSLYVPPAWAMGPLAPDAFGRLPFALYEVLTGIWTVNGFFTALPMVGYECDTMARAAAVRLWNRVNRARASAAGWLRIAIHPRDPGLRLDRELMRDLGRYTDRVGYADLERRRPWH